MSEAKHAALLLFIVALVYYTATVIGNPFSVPVPVAETPKQSYHVAYFWVCEQLVGTLITTDPPTWHDVQDGLPSREIIDLMIAVEDTSRSVNVKYWHQGCFTLVPPDLPERT